MDEVVDYEPSAAPADPLLRWRRFAWVLYDWANSGFGLIVIGPLFQSYFSDRLMPERREWMAAGQEIVPHGLEVLGVRAASSSVLAILVAAVAAMICVAAPVLGALADRRGLQKPLFVGFATAGALVTLLAAFLIDGAWLAGAAIYVAGYFCFGISNTFYNSYLCELAPPAKQGSLSGWGFAAGYVGGLVAMLLAFWLLPPNLGLAMAGVWWFVFALPAFVLMPSPPATAPAGRLDVLEPFRQVARTFGELRRYRTLFLFLLSFLVYINGVETVISLSGSFGADVLDMDEGQLVAMFAAVQIVAFFGAVCFGYLADRVGNKPVIVSNLALWVVAAGLTFFVQTPGQYIAIGCGVGLVLGGVQSSSRALMAQLAPAEIRNEAFGFYAIGSKAVAVLGPLLFALLSVAGGPRYGALAVLPFLAVGLVMLLYVRVPAVKSGHG